jgi:hypothetical protein
MSKDQLFFADLFAFKTRLGAGSASLVEMQLL